MSGCGQCSISKVCGTKRDGGCEDFSQTELDSQGKHDRIMLMGNPNSGKSVLFSRLTGVRVIASNYPGTTVGYTKGKMVVDNKPATLIDVPGTYSLEPTSTAEKVASDMFTTGDKIICVLDSTNLERHLFLALSVIEKGKPTIVALNMWDETKKKGIEIDVEKLETFLGVPVVPISALHGQGIKELVHCLGNETCACQPSPSTNDEKWKYIGSIVKNVQRVKHRHPTVWDRISEATVKPLTGIPIAFLAMLFMFYSIVAVGELIIDHITEPFFYDYYGPWIVNLVEGSTEPGLLRDVFIGQPVPVGGELVWDYAQSFGILTTGLFVYLAMVVPFVLMFYVILSFMEDIGYLPRLAVLLDTFFHRLGLHGSTLIPILLGFGCNVPGIMASRILETRKQRFMSAVLISIAIPCAAMSAMIFIVLGPLGMSYVFLVFLSLAVVYIIMAFVLNRFIEGPGYELVIEIPPYRLPSPKALLKKIGWRISSFMKEAVPYMMLGVTLAILAYNTGLMESIGGLTAPIVSGLLGLPEDAVIAILLGLLRKDVAVGVLLPMGLSASQLVVAMIVLGTMFPCIAVFVMLLKEFGIKGLAQALGLMMAVSITSGTIMRLILIGF